jgi:hypothetical protein
MASTETANQKQCRIKTGVVQRCVRARSKHARCPTARREGARHLTSLAAAPRPPPAAGSRRSCRATTPTWRSSAPRWRACARRPRTSTTSRSRCALIQVWTAPRRFLAAPADRSPAAAHPCRLCHPLQVEVQGETEVMIPDTMRRLERAVDELHEFVVSARRGGDRRMRHRPNLAGGRIWLPHLCYPAVRPPPRPPPPADRQRRGAGGLGAARRRAGAAGRGAAGGRVRRRRRRRREDMSVRVAEEPRGRQVALPRSLRVYEVAVGARGSWRQHGYPGPDAPLTSQHFPSATVRFSATSECTNVIVSRRLSYFA